MPLQRFFKEKHPELISLVSLGSLSGVEQKLLLGWDPNVQNADGITPALKAAERNDLAMLTRLINAGARVDVTDLFGFTPLRYASLHKNEDMINVIIKAIVQTESSSLVTP